MTSNITNSSTSKPKTKRAKAVKRRGARVEEDEGEDSTHPLTTTAPDSDQSDLSDPDDSDDEDDSDDDEDEDEEKEETVEEHKKNWSDDLPTTEDSTLPILDFSTLTQTLDSLPSPQPTTTTTTKPKPTKQDKKAFAEAKSLAFKARDPTGWEVAEEARKEREKEKKKKIKEKRKLSKLAKSTVAPPPPSDPTPASASTPAPTPTIPTGPRNNNRPIPPSRPSRTSLLAPSLPPLQPQQQSAREAYAEKLAKDPSYTPRVGKFWSHDERLAEVEVRPLNAFWRGRGRGGEFGGFGGRGRGRGGRGGFGFGGAGTGVGRNGTGVGEKKEDEGEEGDEDEDDDGWGRGEAKRKQVVSRSQLQFGGGVAAISSWNHDGFQELEELGKVNPKYKDLPFHPLHRFPVAKKKEKVEAVPEDVVSSKPVLEGKSLFELEEGEGGVVKLPTTRASSTTSSHPQPQLEPQSEEPRGVVINLGPRSNSAATTVYPKTSEELRQQSNSILYAADPNRHLRFDPSSQLPPPPQPSHIHQLPPHLQPQPQFIPQRHSSPVFYLPPLGQQFYSPDSPFPNLPTPGITPPPQLQQSQSSQPQFFVPPPIRGSTKIEIKHPGTSHSPINSRPSQSHSQPQPQRPLSASGDSFRPLQRISSPAIPYSSAKAPSFHPVPLLPQQQPQFNSNPYYHHQQGGIESGGVVYFPQQQYYPPPTNGGVYSNQVQDPAILSAGFYQQPNGNGGEWGLLQQQQLNWQNQNGNNGAGGY